MTAILHRAPRGDGPAPRDAARFRIDGVKTSLGIWALGSMITRFVPGGYQPEHAERDDRRPGAPRGRRARRPDGRLRVPLPAGAVRRQPRRGPRGARRPRDLLRRDRAPPRPALRPGRARLARPGDPRRGACAGRVDAADFAGRIGAHFIIWPGIEGYNYPFQTPYAESWEWFIEGIGQAAETCARARREALPRAQELRAGDEDPHAQHRHDAARDPQAARPGDRQRAGQHGLAAPAHERRDPRRVRGAARRRGAARPPARELAAGATFDDDNMVGATAFMETLELAVELRRAGYGRERRAARLRPLPVHRGRGRGRASAACCSGGSSTSVAAQIDDEALREAQSPEGRGARLRDRLRGARRVSEVAELARAARRDRLGQPRPRSRRGRARARSRASWPGGARRPGSRSSVEEAAPGRPNVVATARGIGRWPLAAAERAHRHGRRRRAWSGRSSRASRRAGSTGAAPYDMKGALAAIMVAGGAGARARAPRRRRRDGGRRRGGRRASARRRSSASRRADAAIVTEPTEERVVRRAQGVRRPSRSRPHGRGGARLASRSRRRRDRRDGPGARPASTELDARLRAGRGPSAARAPARCTRR